jgi:hypothetical protein
MRIGNYREGKIMNKEKVFIVVSHKHSLVKGTQDKWETAENVEFVNQLRNRHHEMSSAIGDYINRKMISGSRYNMNDYEKYEEYIRSKYKKQMDELDVAYSAHRIEKEENAVFADEFGNIREKTVFDV